MIKKARFRFILITMSILLVIFYGLFLGFSFVLSTSADSSANSTLDETFNSFKLNPNLIGKDCAIVFEDINKTCTYAYDDNAYTASSINNLYNLASKSFDVFGKLGNFHYKIFQLNNGKAFVFIDSTETIKIIRVVFLNVSLILVAIYLFLFAIVYLLSYTVLRPVKEALYKQRRFISDASHELKTPLTIINANADVLSEMVNNEWLDNIKSQTERMNTLVADMLSLAKIDEHKVKLTKTNLDLSSEVLSTTLSFDAVAFEQHKTLILDIDENINYYGDAESVKKIVTILVDNAIKYCSLENQIKVSLKLDGFRPVLSVFNTGSNVKTGKANKIFERFYRGENSRSRTSGGSGLGLSIAKSISDLNGWKISAYSELNKSMEFTVIFK